MELKNSGGAGARGTQLSDLTGSQAAISRFFLGELNQFAGVESNYAFSRRSDLPQGGGCAFFSSKILNETLSPNGQTPVVFCG
jgi:hypothetical protein